MGKHSELPVSERREAVLSLLRREETAVAIARRYGVSDWFWTVVRPFST
jgi:hypothetical protein